MIWNQILFRRFVKERPFWCFRSNELRDQYRSRREQIWLGFGSNEYLSRFCIESYWSIFLQIFQSDHWVFPPKLGNQDGIWKLSECKLDKYLYPWLWKLAVVLVNIIPWLIQFRKLNLLLFQRLLSDCSAFLRFRQLRKCTLLNECIKTSWEFHWRKVWNCKFLFPTFTNIWPVGLIWFDSNKFW